MSTITRKSSWMKRSPEGSFDGISWHLMEIPVICSYASYSVCSLSVCHLTKNHWAIIHISKNNAILGHYIQLLVKKRQMGSHQRQVAFLSFESGCLPLPQAHFLFFKWMEKFFHKITDLHIHDIQKFRYFLPQCVHQILLLTTHAYMLFDCN